MRLHSPIRSSRGFALIAAISVLLLLTLLATAFLSLSSVTVRSSRLEWAEEEAKANARLGLMIAIGELQRELGPDRRIAVNAAILDKNPDTLDIDGVANPHWLGVMSTVYEGQNAGPNDSPFSRDRNTSSMQDARDGTSYQAANHILGYLVSGNEGGRERMSAGQQFLDAVTERITVGSEGVQLVGGGSVDSPTDEVMVKRMAFEKRRSLPDGLTEWKSDGNYAWWVTSDNHKAAVGKKDRHLGQALRPNGDGIERMLHAHDFDPSVMEDILVGAGGQDGRVLSPKSLTLIDPSNREGVRTNFHSLTDVTHSTIVNVRDGGHKKNLTAFFNTSDGDEPPSIGDRDSSLPYYIGISKGDRLVGPPNSSYAQLRGESYNQSGFQDTAPTFELLWNWANLAGTFQFENGKTGIREPKIWQGAPFVDPLGISNANVYDRENLKPVDPRNLSQVKMTPVIVEAAAYYNLATYPRNTGALQEHVLRLCLYPRVGLWNPYNVEMQLDRPMLLQLFLNGKKSVEFDGNNQFTREIYYGGRRDSFDSQYGGQVYFKLPAVTIPPGETFIFSMGGSPKQLDINNFGSNLLQADEAPSSASYLYKDYVLNGLSGRRLAAARDSDNRNSELMPKAPSRFREAPLSLGENGADNYMFMLKSLEDEPNNPTRASFPNEPMLSYASIALQAGGGDEYPIAWNSSTQADVVQLSGASDHVDEGVTPHPFTRDGFRVRWLEETESNKGPGGMNELFLQSSALGNWNLRAAYTCRNPFDNVTSTTPYFHGIYTRDNPSDEVSWGALNPVLRAGFQTGFPFGPAGFGVDRVIAFEVPTTEVGIPSLGYLRHLNMSEYVWHPSYTVGSSIADPRVESDRTTPENATGQYRGWDSEGLATRYWAALLRNVVFELPEENHLVYDMSYEVNHNLWSDFFVTGATTAQIANFADDPVQRPLKNGSLRLWDRSGDSTDDLNDFFRAASRLMIEGGFDVHSTNKEAWKALLATTRDTGFASSERTPFPRVLTPKGLENDKSDYSTKVFTGFRSMGDTELDSLAEAIVREVKIRAPFFGLADFVNRRLSSNERDETSRSGALESAIENSLVNRGMNSKFPIDRTEIMDQGPLQAQNGLGQSPQQTDLTRLDPRLKPASTGYGTPGYLTQGDVLQVLGSTLVTRSDTFTVRSYGEAKDVHGNVLARAWCEAKVQRTPEPINPDEITGLNPAIPSNDEVDFGRRFQVVAFRWLNEEEV